MCSNKINIMTWFDLYEEVVEHVGITDPRRIWNVDESGVEDIPRVGNVIGLAGQDTYQIVSGEKGTRTTFLTYVNAAGEALPPMIIHKGSKVRPGWEENLMSGAILRASKKGYINKDLFSNYGKKLIFHLAAYDRLDEPNIIIMDGHYSHSFNYEYMHTMFDHNIKVIALRSHTSHVIQALDNIPFRVFKHYWDVKLRKMNMSKAGKKITKPEFNSVFNVAWFKAMTPHNIRCGFRNTGLWPISREAINSHKLAPSAISEMCESA